MDSRALYLFEKCASMVPMAVGSTLRSVNYISESLRDELESICRYELIRAALRCKPDATVDTFRAYAYRRMRGAILDELRRIDPLSRSERTKRKRYQAAVDAYRAEHGHDPDDKELAKILNLNPVQFQRLSRSVQQGDVVLISLDNHSDGVTELNLHDCLADDMAVQADQEATVKDTCAEISKAMRNLEPRIQNMFVMYYWNELTLAEIGEIFGLSEARVSQIMKNGRELLRKQLMRKLDPVLTHTGV